MFLLDTNVVSEARRSPERRDPHVTTWLSDVDVLDTYLSVITVGEIQRGILQKKRTDPTSGNRLEAWFEDEVLPLFSGRVLPVTYEIAYRDAELHVPNPRPIRDGLIAATALVHGLIVATRNVADFAPTGVQIVNPWEPRAREG